MEPCVIAAINVAHDGTHVDDAAPAVPPHLGRGLLGQHGGADQVAVEDALEGRGAERVERLPPVDARVVHQDVEATVPLDHGGDGGAAGVLVTNVKVDGGALGGRARLQQRSPGSLEIARTRAVQHDGRTLVSKPERHGMPDATGRAGHKGHAAVQPEQALGGAPWLSSAPRGSARCEQQTIGRPTLLGFELGGHTLQWLLWLRDHRRRARAIAALKGRQR